MNAAETTSEVAPGQTLGSPISRWSLAAGVVLVAAPSLPWFGSVTPTGWQTPLVANLHQDIPSSLGSYGLVIFVLGVLAVLTSMDSSAVPRRVIGIIAVTVILAATITVGEGEFDTVLSWVEMGPWAIFVSGLVLIVAPNVRQ